MLKFEILERGRMQTTLWSYNIVELRAAVVHNML